MVSKHFKSAHSAHIDRLLASSKSRDESYDRSREKNDIIVSSDIINTRDLGI